MVHPIVTRRSSSLPGNPGQTAPKCRSDGDSPIIPARHGSVVHRCLGSHSASRRATEPGASARGSCQQLIRDAAPALIVTTKIVEGVPKDMIVQEAQRLGCRSNRPGFSWLRSCAAHGPWICCRRRRRKSTMFGSSGSCKAPSPQHMSRPPDWRLGPVPIAQAIPMRRRRRRNHEERRDAGAACGRDERSGPECCCHVGERRTIGTGSLAMMVHGTVERTARGNWQSYRTVRHARSWRSRDAGRSPRSASRDR